MNMNFYCETLLKIILEISLKLGLNFFLYTRDGYIVIGKLKH